MHSLGASGVVGSLDPMTANEDGYDEDLDDFRQASLIALHNGQVLNNVHPEKVCVSPCPIHAPSDHHMRDWPLVWRDDRRIMERTCPHGCGHPDPDDAKIAYGLDPGVHGCDGCCTRSTSVAR